MSEQDELNSLEAQVVIERYFAEALQAEYNKLLDELSHLKRQHLKSAP